jgi:hypothetical protein
MSNWWEERESESAEREATTIFYQSTARKYTEMYFIADRFCIDELAQSAASEIVNIFSKLLEEELPGGGEIVMGVLSRAHQSDYLRERLKESGEQGSKAVEDERLRSALNDYAPAVWRAQSTWIKPFS